MWFSSIFSSLYERLFYAFTCESCWDRDIDIISLAPFHLFGLFLNHIVLSIFKIQENLYSRKVDFSSSLFFFSNLFEFIQTAIYATCTVLLYIHLFVDRLRTRSLNRVSMCVCVCHRRRCLWLDAYCICFVMNYLHFLYIL